MSIKTHALINGIQKGPDAVPTQRAFRAIGSTLDDLQALLDALQEQLNSVAASSGVSSVTAGSAMVTVAPTVGDVIVNVSPANFTGIPESAVTNLVTDLANINTAIAGLITDVVAGTNLSGGGTSGSVTLNVVPNPTFAGLTTMTSGFSAGAQSDMTSHKIVNLTNGSAAQDAAAFGQIGTAVNAAVSGTSGRSARFVATNAIGNGGLTDDGTNVNLLGQLRLNGISDANWYLQKDGATHDIYINGAGSGTRSLKVRDSSASDAVRLSVELLTGNTAIAGNAAVGTTVDSTKRLNVASSTAQTVIAAAQTGTALSSVPVISATDSATYVGNGTTATTSFGVKVTKTSTTSNALAHDSIGIFSSVTSTDSNVYSIALQTKSGDSYFGTGGGYASYFNGNVYVDPGHRVDCELVQPDPSGGFSLGGSGHDLGTWAGATGNLRLRSGGSGGGKLYLQDTGTEAVDIAAGGAATSIHGALGVTGLATLTGGFSLGAVGDANSHKITNLTNGSAAQDAAAFGQIATAINAAVSGTSGRSARFTGTNTIGNGAFSDDGTNAIAQGNLTGANDDKYFAWDAGGNDRVGIVKKTGAYPKIAFGSTTNFAIAQSNGATIAAAGTFTDKLTISSAGAIGLVGDSTVTGALSVTGNTTLGDATSDTATVSGILHVGAAQASPELVNLSHATRTVTRWLNGSTAIGYIGSSNALFTGGLVSTLGIYAVGDLRLGGNDDATADLTLSGGNGTFSGSATVSANLTVNGSATLGDASADAHTVNGNVTFSNTPTAGPVKYGSANARLFLGLQTFTAGGTYTPTTGTKAVRVRMCGGGGGGGGAKGTAGGTSWSGAAGGSSGAYFEKWIDAASNVTGGTVTIGAAGSGGASTPANGGAGGDTSVVINGTTYTAKGGGGGTGDSGTSGYNGTPHTAVTSGSSSGDVNSGTPGTGSTVFQNGFIQTGMGGGGVFGVGGVQAYAAGTHPTAATAGTGKGAGGAGGYSNDGTNCTGGAGTAGIVIVEEYA